MELNRGSIRMELNSFIFKGTSQRIDTMYPNITFGKIGRKERQEVKKHLYNTILINRERKKILEQALEKVTEDYEITTYVDRLGEISYISSDSKGNVTDGKEKFQCSYWKKSRKYEETKNLELASLYEVVLFKEYQRLQKQKREKSDNNSRSILVQYNFAFALIDEKNRILGYFYPDNYLDVIEGKFPNHSYLFSLGNWQKAGKNDTII